MKNKLLQEISRLMKEAQDASKPLSEREQLENIAYLHNYAMYPAARKQAVPKCDFALSLSDKAEQVLIHTGHLLTRKVSRLAYSTKPFKGKAFAYQTGNNLQTTRLCFKRGPSWYTLREVFQGKALFDLLKRKPKDLYNFSFLPDDLYGFLNVTKVLDWEPQVSVLKISDTQTDIDVVLLNENATSLLAKLVDPAVKVPWSLVPARRNAASVLALDGILYLICKHGSTLLGYRKDSKWYELSTCGGTKLDTIELVNAPEAIAIVDTLNLCPAEHSVEPVIAVEPNKQQSAADQATAKVLEENKPWIDSLKASDFSKVDAHVEARNSAVIKDSKQYLDSKAGFCNPVIVPQDRATLKNRAKEARRHQKLQKDYKRKHAQTSESEVITEKQKWYDNIPVIGLAGKARVGKDSCAEFIITEQGGYRYGFADPLRAMLKPLGIDFSDPYWVANKEKVIEELGVSPRRLLQTLGTDWGRKLIHPDLWLILAARLLKTASQGMIITDLRFENEAKWVRDKGGIVIHLNRPDAPGVEPHESEAGIAFDPTDVRIVNDGTLEDLKLKVLAILDAVITRPKIKVERFNLNGTEYTITMQDSVRRCYANGVEISYGQIINHARQRIELRF